MKEDVASRIEQGMLRWFGLIERMNEKSQTKLVNKTYVDGNLEAADLSKRTSITLRTLLAKLSLEIS